MPSMPSFLTYETFRARYFPKELITATLAHVERYGHEIDSCVLLAMEEEIMGCVLEIRSNARRSSTVGLEDTPFG
jgi:hypothetical protein